MLKKSFRGRTRWSFLINIFLPLDKGCVRKEKLKNKELHGFNFLNRVTDER